MQKTSLSVYTLINLNICSMYICKYVLSLNLQLHIIAYKFLKNNESKLFIYHLQ